MLGMLNDTERYHGQVKAYFVTEICTGKKVGFSTMTTDRVDGYAILDGAAVHPAYRGKGIYKMMASKRLDDAKKDGLEYTIIHALKNTSAPICKRIGFREICQIDFYGYKIN